MRDSHVKKHHTASGKSKKASHPKYADEKHSLQGKTGKTHAICEQKLYGIRAAPQKYLQHGDGGVGHAAALSAARGGQLVVVKHEQALEMREGPHVATGLGAWIVLRWGERAVSISPLRRGEKDGGGLRGGEVVEAEIRAGGALVAEHAAEAVVAVADTLD
ncbi:hypothetical protein MMC26_004586 [Xylographa opegraphella]|nr:hypothetical protein [Xylographa opegraphella]